MHFLPHPNQHGKDMTEKSLQLQKDLLDVADKSGMTVSEIVGAMEVTKQLLLNESFREAEANVAKATQNPGIPIFPELPAMNPNN